MRTEQKKPLLERLKFWRDEDVKKPGLYQVIVVEVAGACRVNAATRDEGRDETTTQIVETLYQQLNK